MKNSSRKTDTWKIGRSCLLALVLGLAFAAPALGFTVNVVEHNDIVAGTPIASGFSWLLEEDNTNLTVAPDPGDPVVATKSISLDMHKSYAPVVASGSSLTGTASITPPDANGRYILSVLPDTGHSQGGIIVSGDPATPLTVVVHALPIPTAQISILVFKDHAPINNAYDDGEPLLNGAAVTLHDAAGQQMMDGLGNPLGTTYLPGTSTVNVLGNGIILSGADGIDGEVIIKFLSPGKYGVVVSPPTVDPLFGGEYVQTSTIEGTKTVDAWVKADEPEQFVEGFGTGFHHVFIGFVNPAELAWALTPPAPGGRITGNLRYNHFDKPPANQGFHIGPPVAECWVGLNDPVSGQGLYATPCFDGVNASSEEIPSSFVIPNVPPGTYELVTWDKPLDALFNFKSVTMPAAGDLDLETILSFRWFGSFLGTVFLDEDEDGYRDPGDVDNAPLGDFPGPGGEDIDLNSNGIFEPGEIGLAEQNINIRFRDGTIYQAQPTDIFGGYALEEVFPFFKWLVVEVDFARFKATGMTAAVDDGGLIPAGFDENDPWGPLPKVPTFEQLTPQPQAADNINTGNNMSRTETGEVLTQAMHLFLNQTNVIDWGKRTYTGTENGGISGVVMYAVTRAENDPRFAAGEEWEPGIPRVQINLYQDLDNDNTIDDLNGDGPTPADVDNYPLGNFPGSEDVDHNSNSTFDPGDAIQITYTDSWDDSLPSGCVQTLPVVHGQPIPECADAFGTWNQLRPGVFDGGYALASYFPGGMTSGSLEVDGLPSGQFFIVEAANPPGYDLVKEEDKNVDFGNEHQPSTQLLAPICVGEPHTIPQYLSFQTDAAGVPLPSIDPADWIESPYWVAPTGTIQRPLCDRKSIGLNARENAAADFFFFTKVPKAARAVGFSNNDLSAEFNQGSPNFGEKAAPSWIPVAFKDWKGNEVARVYTDEFGGYNAMLPSTFTVNVPSPTGVSPNMLTLVLNDPVLPDGSPDPHYNPDYSVTPWTFHYEAGRTTYLDTPLVPVAAFVNFPQGNLDAEPQHMTPMLSTVTGPEPEFGPLICLENNPLTAELTLTSPGTSVSVPNPDYDENDPTSPATITRDFGFGDSKGTVLLDGVDITDIGFGNSTVNDPWLNDSISITLDTDDPAITAITNGLLTVIRADNERASETGITLTITDCSTGVHFVQPGGVYPSRPIQDAIDAPGTLPGDLILVAAGTYYENVIMNKPVRLQGAGGANTIISANPNPTDRLAWWHNEIDTRLGSDPFTANETPGIMVLGAAGGDFTIGTPTFIDGFTISGSISGGGIMVHTAVHDLVISNNRITNNQGMFAGGIIIGTPPAVDETPSNNFDITIRGNWIAKNGGIQGGGGIGLYTGANNYLVEDNIIIGNFSRFRGGGINHVGRSVGGVISHNKILFNEIFYGLLLIGAGDGGGINLAGDIVDGVGAGSVLVDGNLIQGNLAGSGLGGGINTFAFNTAGDIASTLTITNNMIVNNVAGLAAGGVYLHDTTAVTIWNNTIVNNDATATASLAFPPNSANSNPQPAGLVASAFSPNVATAAAAAHPLPALENNIIQHNRSFYNDALYNNSMGGLVFNGYWDLAVVNTLNPADQLTINNSFLTSLTGPNLENYGTGNNSIDDPAFVHSTVNNLFSAAVLDEGGNSISVRMTPLSEGAANYHLNECSPARDVGIDTGLADDIDRDLRDDGNFDIGADEFVPAQTEYTQLTLLNPVGGEIIPADSEYWISWGDPGPDTLRYALYYSLDGGQSWLLIDFGVSGHCYLWTLPAKIQANQQVKIRIISFSLPLIEVDRDDSDAVFTIDIDALLSPNGGETLIYDDLAAQAATPNTYTITWVNNYAAAAADNKVTLEYQIDGGAWIMFTDVDNAPTGDFPGPGDIDYNGDGTLDALTGNDSSYVWEIPLVTDHEDALIRLVITDTNSTPLILADDSLILTDVSDSFFTIRPAAVIPPADPPTLPADPPVAGDPTPPVTGAGIFFQCPGYDPLVDIDHNGDGLLRADYLGPGGELEISTPLTANQVCLHLAAGDGFARMADGRGQYMFSFSNVTGIPDDEVMNMWSDANPGSVLGANFPAPLIKLKQNDEVYLTLSNVGMMMRPDLFDPHTVHWHGFPQAASIFDGVPEASVSINMGSSLTYFYRATEAGTFMYHCHVEATEHMQMGMLGNLYVTPVQDGTPLNGFTTFAYNDVDGSTGYDKEYHIQIAAFDPDFHDASENTQPLPFALMDDKYPMINGRGYPDTVDAGVIQNALGYGSQREHALITVDAADTKVLLRISSLSVTSFHTITVLGIPMQVVGQGSRKYGPPSNTDQYRSTNSVTIGGGQAVDVLLDVGAVSAGTYFLYVTNLDHLSNNAEDFGGMMTEIVINP